MAAPRDSLGAHYGGSSLLGQMNKLVQGFLKLTLLHVVSEAAEAGISPSTVNRVRTGMPQAAKPSHMPIVNPRLLEWARQPALIELRIVSRAGDRPNIDELLDAVSKK